MKQIIEQINDIMRNGGILPSTKTKRIKQTLEEGVRELFWIQSKPDEWYSKYFIIYKRGNQYSLMDDKYSSITKRRFDTLEEVKQEAQIIFKQETLNRFK